MVDVDSVEVCLQDLVALVNPIRKKIWETQNISKIQCTMCEGVREDTVNNYWQLHTLMNCEKEKATRECQNNNSNTVQEHKSYYCHVDVQ